jgi:putative membrane protein
LNERVKEGVPEKCNLFLIHQQNLKIMNKLILQGKVLLLLLAALALVTACDDDDDDDDRLTVQSFMEQAAASDTFEITTGNMAQQKGTLADVKTLGQMLVQDHTMSSQELKALARQKSVTLPKTIPGDKAAKIAALGALSGPAFDKDFAQKQVEAHQEAIALYEKADNDIGDAQIQAFVKKTLPVLQTHLQHAQHLVEVTK